MILLFVHGWGFDPGFWRPLRQHLAEWPALCLDLGYYGAEDLTLPPGPAIAIGHSYGLAWLLNHRRPDWRAVISVNGFTRFAGGETFISGVKPRQIERLRQDLATEPDQAVAAFRRRWGDDSTPPGPARADRLRQGLQDLRDWDLRGQAVDLALCGESDRLIAPDHSRACFAPGLIRWHAGGHLLPLEDPHWCAAQLRGLILEKQ